MILIHLTIYSSIVWDIIEKNIIYIISIVHKCATYYSQHVFCNRYKHTNIYIYVYGSIVKHSWMELNKVFTFLGKLITIHDRNNVE